MGRPKKVLEIKNEVVNFTDIHDRMVEVRDRLTSYADFTKYINENIKVKNYINIIDKYVLMRLFSIKFATDFMNNEEVNDDGIDYLFIEFDIALVFNLLFKYTNINIDDKYKTIDNYDLVMSTGLYDIILETCKSDYDRLVTRFESISGMDNINLMREFSKTFRDVPTIEEIERIKNDINGMDTENLKELGSILQFNDPITKEISDTIKGVKRQEVLAEI